MGDIFWTTFCGLYSAIYESSGSQCPAHGLQWSWLSSKAHGYLLALLEQHFNLCFEIVWLDQDQVPLFEPMNTLSVMRFGAALPSELPRLSSIKCMIFLYVLIFCYLWYQRCGNSFSPKKCKFICTLILLTIHYYYCCPSIWIGKGVSLLNIQLIHTHFDSKSSLFRFLAFTVLADVVNN